MPPLPTGEPVWDLQFNEDGKLTSPAQGSFLAEVAAAGVTDLFVFSHGWGTSQDSARQLYNKMFPLIRTATRAFSIPCIETEGLEADDIIACYVKAALAAGLPAAPVRRRAAQTVMPRVTAMNRQKKAISDTFWRFPIEWRSTIEIGSNAGGGIARQYSMCGIAQRRAQRERPSGMPSTTPACWMLPSG